MKVINPLRPEKKPEHFQSYVDRLGLYNHYIVKRWSYHALEIKGTKNLNFISNEETIEKISKLTGLSLEEIWPMTVASVETFLLSGTFEYFNRLPQIDSKRRKSFHQKFLVAANKRFCPLCLDEKPVGLLPWLFRPITTCFYHNLRLLDRCPGCNQRISSLNFCEFCGLEFSEMEYEGFSKDDIDLKYSKFIWELFGFIDYSYIDKLDMPMQIPFELAYFILAMGDLLIRFDQKNSNFSSIDLEPTKKIALRSQSLELNHAANLSAFELLIDWPNAWEETLERVVSQEQDYRKRGFPKRRSFIFYLQKGFSYDQYGWLFDKTYEFIQAQPINSTKYSFWWSSFRQIRSKEILPEVGNWISIYEVVSQLKFGFETIRKLVDLNCLQPIKGVPEHDIYQWKFNRGRIIQFENDVIRSDECAQIIGINVSTLRYWAKENYLPVVVSPHQNNIAFYLFSRKEIEHWKSNHLTGYEVKDVLGISQRTYENWIAKGLIEPIRFLGKRPYWFSKKTIDNLKISFPKGTQELIDKFEECLEYPYPIQVDERTWNLLISNLDESPKAIKLKRDVLNAILWLISNSEMITALPKRFPSRRTVRRYLKFWDENNLFPGIAQVLNSIDLN